MNLDQRWKVLALGLALYLVVPQAVMAFADPRGFLVWFSTPSLAWLVPMVLTLFQIRSGGNFWSPLRRIRTGIAVVTATVILWLNLELMHSALAHMLFAPHHYFTIWPSTSPAAVLLVGVGYAILGVALVWFAPNTPQNRRIQSRFWVALVLMAYNLVVLKIMEFGILGSDLLFLYPTFYVFLPLAALVVLDAPWWPRVGRWWEERRAAS